MDHKSEKSSGQHRDNAGADHRQVCHVETAEHQADDEDHNIVYAEECLDSCQVFLFAFGGRQKVEGCCGTAGGEEPVADAADDAQDRAGDRIGLYVDLVREHKEEDRDRYEHDAQHKVHDVGTDLGRQEVDNTADDGCGDQKRQHDSPPDRISVFDGDIDGTDGYHDN